VFSLLKAPSKEHLRLINTTLGQNVRCAHSQAEALPEHFRRAKLSSIPFTQVSRAVQYQDSHPSVPRQSKGKSTGVLGLGPGYLHLQELKHLEEHSQETPKLEIGDVQEDPVRQFSDGVLRDSN
jgi:hypothetical protein